MKTSTILFALSGLFSIFKAPAQNIANFQSFESAMLGSASAIPKGLSSFLQNPAAAGFSPTTGFAFFQHNWLSIPSLNANCLSFKHGEKIKKAYALAQAGSSFFRLLSAQFALANQIGKSVSLGVSISINAIPSDENVTYLIPEMAIGVCWKPASSWEIGFVNFNPMQAQQRLNLAFTWRASPNFEWSFSVQKQGQHPQTFQAGMRYQLRPTYLFYSSFRTSPYLGAFGFEFPCKKVNLGIGSKFLAMEGLQGCFSLTYPLVK